MRGTLVRRVWKYNPVLDAPPRYRRACEYDAFIPLPLSDLSLDIPGHTTGVLLEAERAIADLNRVAGPELAPLARLLLRTESVGSSKVEGMQIDARNLARAEVNQETGRRVGPEAAEILGNIDAMQVAIEGASAPKETSVENLIEIHRVLMARAPNSRIAGRLRESQSWIGGNNYNPCDADFVPPPPEEVERLLDDLCSFCNDELLPAIAQAAIAHAQFETIHPFEDGNGRVGRTLIQVILRRRGLAPAFVPPISVVLAMEKERYIQGLTLFRQDRLPEWLEVFAVASNRAARLATHYSQEVFELQKGWRQQLRDTSNPRSDAAAWAIIDILPAHPVVTVPVAVAATKRTKPAVTMGITTLENAGILQRLGDSPRNRAWEARGLLDVIVRLEAGTE